MYADNNILTLAPCLPTKHNQTQEAQASNSGSNFGSTSDSQGVDENVEIMAEAPVALAVVGVVGAMMALWISVRNARHTKKVSEGEFKPFVCI